MGEKRSITPYGIYIYGSKLKLLEDKTRPYTLLLSFKPNIKEIKNLLSGISVLEDVVLFEKIGKHARKWRDWLEKENALPLSAAVELLRAISVWEREFTDSLQKLGLWYLNTATLDAEKLLNGLKSFLTEDEINWLTDLERISLEDSIFCILTGRATPAEFMCVRAVESILRRWYKWKTGRDVEKKTFGKVLGELSDEYGRDHPEQLSLMRYLKSVSRDRLAHPEKISTQEEAEQTFSLVIKLIKEVYKAGVDTQNV